MGVEFDLHIGVTLGLVGLAACLFAWERIPTETAALLLLAILLAFFHFFPLPGPERLDMARLLAGFGNPALIAVLALLVLGEGLVQTDALNALGRLAGPAHRLRRPWLVVCLILAGVAAASAFVNNTPLVIIFIPILQALAQRLRIGSSKMMMPLSFATILGGMTTLLGSSTNLLVSTSLVGLERPPLGIFEVTPIGLAVAGVGLAYLFLVAPRLLPDRTPVARSHAEGGQFLAQLRVTAAARIAGGRVVAGMLRSRPDLVIKTIRRGDETHAQPLDGFEIAAGDVLSVVATRAALEQALASDPGLLPDAAAGQRAGGRVLVEAMVAPRSPLVGASLADCGFRRQTDCMVVGVRRRAHLVRPRGGDVALEAGDVLLLLCVESSLAALRGSHEFVVLEGSARDLPRPRHGRRAIAIFAASVGLAVSGTMPIALAAVLGAVALVVTGTIGLRQAFAALDRRIIMLVGAALALGEAMQATGAALWLADGLVRALDGVPPGMVLTAFFGLVLAITNVLSNNACAVLFTPIAVALADRLGMDPHIFAIAVLIASDASFATPIGYQTNLLVMGPGRYRFADFVRVGGPLSLLVWAVFAVAATAWFGLAWR